MKPENGCMYVSVERPGSSSRFVAVGKLTTTPAESRLPAGRSSHKTALAMAMRLPNSVSSKPGPPGTAPRVPVAGSGPNVKSLASAFIV